MATTRNQTQRRVLPQGLVPVAVTPFRRDGALDRRSFQQNLEGLVEGGAVGLLVAGSIGEQPHLSASEIRQLTRLARQAVGPDIPLIVGVGLEGTRLTANLCESVGEVGASLAMVRPPGYYGGDYTQDSLQRHFEMIASRSPIPLVLYNSPEFVRTSLSVELVEKLGQHSNIAGIKECSGNLEYLTALTKVKSLGLSRIAVGFDPLLPQALDLGIGCAMMTLANAVPEIYIQLLTLHRSGDVHDFREVFEKLRHLLDVIFQHQEVAAIKAAMTLRGRRGGHPRAPLEDTGGTQIEKIRKALAAIPV